MHSFVCELGCRYGLAQGMVPCMSQWDAYYPPCFAGYDYGPYDHLMDVLEPQFYGFILVFFLDKRWSKSMWNMELNGYTSEWNCEKTYLCYEHCVMDLFCMKNKTCNSGLLGCIKCSFDGLS